MSVPVILYTYEYMWKVKGSDSVKFKIITDVLDGHTQFIDMLKKVDNIECASRTYLSEVDVSKYHTDEVLFKDVILEDEK